MKQDDLEHSAELVKPPQSRRGKGWSVVYKQAGDAFGLAKHVFIKRQSGYFTRVWWRAFRLTPRLVCEHRALQFCHNNGIEVPNVISYSPGREMTELILEDVGPAKEFDDFLEDSASNEERQQAILQAAELIGRLHSLGWIHGALGRDHVLIRSDGSAVLIDFEKAHWNPLKVSRDIARFWRRIDPLGEDDKTLFMQRYEAVRG